MKCSIVREIDSLDRLIRQGSHLNCAVVQGMDLREVDLPWDELECEGAVFLGCLFPNSVSVCDLLGKGALVFPHFSGLPYNPYRPELYSREELMEGWTPEKDESVDKKIYDHFVKFGKRQPDIVEALAERLHDHAVDDGLTDLLEGRVEKDGVKKVVSVMGGHGTGRDELSFRRVAHLTRRLTQEGFFVASGGGPGTMEAANLGAYLADLSRRSWMQFWMISRRLRSMTMRGISRRQIVSLRSIPQGILAWRCRHGFMGMSRRICFRHMWRSIFLIAFVRMACWRFLVMELFFRRGVLERRRKFSKMLARITMRVWAR